MQSTYVRRNFVYGRHKIIRLFDHANYLNELICYSHAVVAPLIVIALILRCICIVYVFEI